MDNSQFGTGPSQEWLSFGAAHPELAIDADGKNDDALHSDPAAIRLTINAGREEAPRALFARDGLESKVIVDNYAIPVRDGTTIPMRLYRPAQLDRAQHLPVYLYYHGGGMMFGTVDSEDYACATWAHRLGFAVIHVCYRHTPEFTFPTQHHDAWDAFEWVVANTEILGIDAANIVVGGISAGALLTASVLFEEVRLARQQGRELRVKGQLLVIPWLIHRDAYPLDAFASPEKASVVQCVDAPILPKQRYDLFHDMLKVADPADPLVNVALASDEDLGGMPRTAFIVTGWDMVRDDAFLLASKLDRLGVPTKKHVFPGLPHAFRRWPDLSSSKRWDEVTLNCVCWCLGRSVESDDTASWLVETHESILL